MINTCATVKTYIEDHWRLNPNTSGHKASTPLGILSDSLTPIPAKGCQYGHVSTFWNPLRYIGLHCTHFFDLFWKLRLLSICSEREYEALFLNQTRPFWQLTLAQSHAENRWTVAHHGCAGPPWTARRSSLLLLHPGLIPRKNTVGYQNVLKCVKHRLT